MKCSFCGKELKEGALFCSFCGTKVSAAQNAPAYTDMGVTVGAEDVSVKKKKKKDKKEGKKKRVLVALCIILSIVILSTALAIGLMPLLNNDVLFSGTAVRAYVNSDGRAYICYGDRKCEQVGENIKEARLTSDTERVVILNEDGKLYFTDAKGNNSVDIYSSADKEEVSLKAVSDNMVLYTVRKIGDIEKNQGLVISQEGASSIEYYAYYFEGQKNTSIGTYGDLATISTSTSMMVESGMGSVAYAKDGTVYVLRGDNGEIESVGSYSDTEEVYINGVSSDGKYVLWSKGTESKVDVVLSCDGKKGKIKSYDPTEESYEFSLNCVLGESDSAVVTSNDCIYVIKDDKIVTRSISDGDVLPYVVAMNGLPVSMCEEFDWSDGFFILTEVEEGYTVLLMDKKLKSYELVSDIEDFYVSDGYFMYEKEDGLFAAELDVKKHTLKNTNKVSGVEAAFDMTFVGKMAYFTDDKGTLYRYDAENDKKIEIASSVRSFYPTEDGTEVYYITDVETDPIIYGTLMMTNEDGEDVTVAKDVIVGTVTSNMWGDVLSSGSVWFNTYSSSFDDGYKFNCVYYNGKKTKTVIKNVAHTYSVER